MPSSITESEEYDHQIPSAHKLTKRTKETAQFGYHWALTREPLVLSSKYPQWQHFDKILMRAGKTFMLYIKAGGPL